MELCMFDVWWAAQTIFFASAQVCWAASRLQAASGPLSAARQQHYLEISRWLCDIAPMALFLKNDNQQTPLELLMANTPSRRGARGKLLALDDLKYSTHTHRAADMHIHIYIYTHIYIYRCTWKSKDSNSTSSWKLVESGPKKYVHVWYIMMHLLRSRTSKEHCYTFL